MDPHLLFARSPSLPFAASRQILLPSSVFLRRLPRPLRLFTQPPSGLTSPLPLLRLSTSTRPSLASAPAISANSSRSGRSLAAHYRRRPPTPASFHSASSPGSSSSPSPSPRRPSSSAPGRKTVRAPSSLILRRRVSVIIHYWWLVKKGTQKKKKILPLFDTLLLTVLLPRLSRLFLSNAARNHRDAQIRIETLEASNRTIEKIKKFLCRSVSVPPNTVQVRVIPTGAASRHSREPRMEGPYSAFAFAFASLLVFVSLFFRFSHLYSQLPLPFLLSSRRDLLCFCRCNYFSRFQPKNTCQAPKPPKPNTGNEIEFRHVFHPQAILIYRLENKQAPREQPSRRAQSFRGNILEQLIYMNIWATPRRADVHDFQDIYSTKTRSKWGGKGEEQRER